MSKQRHKSIDKEVHAEPKGINDEETRRDDKRTKLRERERHNESILQKAIMSWTKKYQQDYLKSKKKPIHGTKGELTDRIMSTVSIEDAMKISKEYKRMKLEMAKTMDEQVTNKIVPLTEEEKEKMELISKRKREEQGSHTPNKINIHEDIRITPTSIQDEVRNEDAEIMEIDISTDKNKERVMDERVDEEEIEREVSKITIEEEKESTRNDSESVATTKVDNIRRTRIGMMITLPPSKEPDKCLSAHLKKWFNKMKEIDNKFTVISWKTEEGPKQPIKEEGNIPNTISKLRVYFTRAQVKTIGGKVFMDVFVQHTIPMDEIRGDAEWFMEENQIAMYKKRLQVEETIQQGWLLYSTQTLDKEALAAAIEREIGAKVALRWKYINSINFVEDTEERKKWMALHIEVDAKESKKASRGLNRLYGRQSEHFPMGIRMRLVTEFKEVRGNTSMISKHTRLRARQASFISLIEGCISEDIQMLDYEDEGMTLREMIMSIQSKNPNTPGNLFHAVGRDWKGRITFNFLKNKAEEARMIVDGLIPYLQHKYGNTVNVFFDAEAVIEKETWQWDEEKRMLITPLAKELDGIEEIDQDYDFTGETEDGNKEGNNNKNSENEKRYLQHSHQPKPSAEDLALTKLNLIVTGEDTDSVSTLGNPTTPATRKEANASNIFRVRAGLSTNSSITETSMESRMSAIEHRITSMEKSITHSLEKAITEIITKGIPKTPTSKTTQLPGGESAGSQNE